MTAKRIIACLDVKDGKVVKGINFLNLKLKGDPVELASRYEEEGADEIVKIEKISQSMYKAKNKAGNMFLFKIVNDNIVEESLKPLQETIVSLLKEYGGEVDMSDVVNIISKKYGLSKDATRQELLFLKQLGILDIKNKKVFLTQLL